VPLHKTAKDALGPTDFRKGVQFAQQKEREKAKLTGMKELKAQKEGGEKENQNVWFGKEKSWGAKKHISSNKRFFYRSERH